MSLRVRRLLGVILLGVMIGGTVGGLPAAAHTEVEVEPAVGGAVNAMVTFSSEAEWDRAGISAVAVTLPAGIAPTDVTLASGPAGWTLTPGPDSYTVTGPPLPTSRDAKHAVSVRQLPNTPTLVFKVLVTYSDGHVDRWIEVPSAANPKPDNPAPVATLKAPPGGFQTAPPAAASSAPPEASAAASASTGNPVASNGPATNPLGNDVIPSDDGSPWPWIALTGLAVLIAGGALVVWRRRAARASGAR
jgi:hypothetical protein